MKIDNDDKQRAYVVSNFLIQAYKLIMGTFLVFFIPQKCGDHACTSLELVLHKNSIIDRSIQGINAFSFFAFIHMLWIELRREKWFITYLDNEIEGLESTLTLRLKDRYDYEAIISKHNKKYIHSLYVLSCISFMNFILSGTYIAYFNFLDLSTITSYFSFALLILSKLYDSYSIGKKSHKNNIALSAYMKEPLWFNTIDIDVVNDRAELPNDYNYRPL